MKLQNQTILKFEVDNWRMCLRGGAPKHTFQISKWKLQIIWLCTLFSKIRNFLETQRQSTILRRNIFEHGYFKAFTVVETFRKFFYAAKVCVVWIWFEVRWKLETLAHRTTGHTHVLSKYSWSYRLSNIHFHQEVFLRACKSTHHMPWNFTQNHACARCQIWTASRGVHSQQSVRSIASP